MHTISTLSNGTKRNETEKRSPTPNPNPHIWSKSILGIYNCKATNGTCDVNSPIDFEIHILHKQITKIIHTMN